MKKLFLLLMIALLLLSACRPQEQAQDSSAPSASQPSEKNDMAPLSDTKESKGEPAESVLEGVVINCEENRVLLRVQGLPVDDKLYVRTDTEFAEPLPALQVGYCVQVRYTEPIPQTLLPEIKASAIYFLKEDDSDIRPVFEEHKERISIRKNTEYPTKLIQEYARFYREVYVGEERGGHFSHLKSLDEFTALWERLESGTYDGYGNSVDYSHLIADYTPAYFEEKDLLVVYLYDSSGGVSYGLYDVVVEGAQMRVQIYKDDVPWGYGTTTASVERLMLIEVPKKMMRGVTASSVQFVYNDETRIIAKENGCIIVDAEHYSIQKEGKESPDGFYRAFKVEEYDSLQVGERVCICHTGVFDNGVIPLGEALSIQREETV